MKKQYQIGKKRAAERFRSWAANNEVPIQLSFPTADIAELAGLSLAIYCERWASFLSRQSWKPR